ncbi:TIGR03668 family PPOX class F420-dependent oxidoreductase [SAR202 cluster bacterium AC-409-J13_OGT_754m]|nr:TIGR03668 family PPOX class F420-dependent oxidoreductase [SAR202 cluster bacterium AC-409-J13_OGT_754m]
MVLIPIKLKSLIADSSIAYLATVSNKGHPHIVPICFVLRDQNFYSLIDNKPKDVQLLKLRRVQNIISNPKVALIVNHYEDDWNKLWHILLKGHGSLVVNELERTAAIKSLKQKYRQYLDMDVDLNPVIKISPTSIVSWGTTRST